MKTLPRSTTVDTTKLQPVELIHINFALYIVTSIRGFTAMLTALCEINRMLLVFTTEYKRSPFRIICFIQTPFNNYQPPYKHLIFDEYSALEKSPDNTNLLVDDFIIDMHHVSMMRTKYTT